MNSADIVCFTGFILGMEPPSTHSMFEFATFEDIDQFEINTDRVMGGKSAMG
jgi:hypothetical protein